MHSTLLEPPPERLTRGAVLLDRDERPRHMEDVCELAVRERASWRPRLSRLLDRGDPMASDWPQSAPVNLLQTSGTFPTGSSAGTYWWAEGSNAPVASGTGGAVAPRFIALRAADWSGVANLDLFVSLTSTAAQTGVTFTFGLYPVTISGTTTVVPTLGTVVSGSTVAFVAPGAASELPGLSSAFAFPAADLYVVGLVVSATSAASSRVMWTCTLRGTKS